MLRIFSSLVIILTLSFIFTAHADGEGVVIEDISPPPKQQDKIVIPTKIKSLLQETDDIIKEAEKALTYSKTKEKPVAVNYGFGKTAILKGLNKITARTSLLIIKKGRKIRFGNLEITLHECWKAPPTEKAETKALVEIWEKKEPGSLSSEKKNRVFLGWMFASSPALSALEHPVYDVTIRDCLG